MISFALDPSIFSGLFLAPGFSRWEKMLVLPAKRALARLLDAGFSHFWWLE
jgi:hypothetical protein